MRTYDDLLAAAQADPEGADFHALRMAYTRTDRYQPYGQDSEGIFALRDALTGGDFAAALEAAQRLLAHNPLDIEAHMAADYVHTALGEEAQAAFHRAFARGLIQAILATGDGRDPATAFIVISTTEEYTVLRVLGYVPGDQRLIRLSDHHFDVLTAHRPGSDETVEFTFNIDLPYGWLQRQKQASGGDHHDDRPEGRTG